MMTDVELVPARIDDAQTIAEMSRRLVEVGLPWTWTPSRVTRHLQHPDCVALTARISTGSTSLLAGFAIMHFGDEYAHLNLLAVDNRHQRRGLGRRMLRWLEESAVGAGVFTVSLEMRARNPVALLFYRHLGYEEIGRVPRYYSGREDALRLACDLRDPVMLHSRYRHFGTDELQAEPEGPEKITADWLATKFKR